MKWYGGGGVFVVVDVPWSDLLFSEALVGKMNSSRKGLRGSALSRDCAYSNDESAKVGFWPDRIWSAVAAKSIFCVCVCVSVSL